MARAPSSTLSAAGVAGRGCGGGRGGRTWGGSFDVDLAPVSEKGLVHPAPPGVGAGCRDGVEIRANHFLHYDDRNMSVQRLNVYLLIMGMQREGCTALRDNQTTSSTQLISCSYCREDKDIVFKPKCFRFSDLDAGKMAMVATGLRIICKE